MLKIGTVKKYLLKVFGDELFIMKPKKKDTSEVHEIRESVRRLSRKVTKNES